MKNQQFARVGKITPQAFYNESAEVKCTSGNEENNPKNTTDTRLK